MNNKYEIVKGSEFIDTQKTPELTIKYFQIAEYKNTNQNYNIRMYIFKSSSCMGVGCEYKIMDVKNYELDKYDLKIFKKVLKNSKNTKDLKIMYKIYPYINFDMVLPPSGNDLSQCTSELLGNN
jgi:hypothetical protein